MTRARSRYIGVGIFLAATAVALYFCYGVYTSPLPSNWSAKYTNLKDDLRSMAINPLDPNIIYIGSDQDLISTNDGGQTWAKLRSFRDNKIAVSDIVSEGALQLLMEIEGRAAAESSAQQAESQSESQSAVSSSRGDGGSGGEEQSAAITAAETKVSELQALLDRAKELQNNATEKHASAEAAVQAFVPDEVSISEVDGVPEEDDGFVPQPHYDELANWLDERGLAVPENGAERKKNLVDYLKSHEEEGAALDLELETATTELNNAITQVTAAQANYDVALSELQAAEATAPDEEEESEVVTETEMADKGPSTSATPILEDGYFTGVTKVAIDPADPAKVFVTTFRGSFVSSDAGASWETLYSGGNTNQSTNITITIDPSNPDNIYIGTLVGMAISNDAGTTWVRPAGRISNDIVTAIAVHPFDSKIIMAGTRGDGILLSRDGGTNWERSFTNPGAGASNVHVVQFAPSNPDIILAGTGGGVYRSIDGGATWEPASGMGLGNYQVHDINISPADSDRIILATEGGVFGSTTGGFQWRRLTYGLNYKGGKEIDFNPLDLEQIWYLTDKRFFASEQAEVVELADEDKGYLTGNCEFSFDGKQMHTLFIEDINEEAGTVAVEIRSEPQKLVLETGKSQEIDLNGDGVNDAVITLESIEEGEPRISVYKMVKVQAMEQSIQLKSAEQIAGLEDLEPYFMAEPSCVEVQEAASRWAEVHPDLIEGWRQGAKFRAFLPQVEVQYTYGKEYSDIDETYSTGTQEFDFYQAHAGYSEVNSSRGDEYAEGFYPSTSMGWPDTYEWYDSYSTFDEAGAYSQRSDYYGTKGYSEVEESEAHGKRKSEAWKIQLDWYLGDFLYERQQLYISREARDLVELRQNILEQVTMYFFDRKAARIDMIMNPPADPYSRLETLLTLQQLDASLDALTGGYFTQTIKDRRKEHPELPVY